MSYAIASFELTKAVLKNLDKVKEIDVIDSRCLVSNKSCITQ